jgi:hypothetical protein
MIFPTALQQDGEQNAAPIPQNHSVFASATTETQGAAALFCN